MDTQKHRKPTTSKLKRILQCKSNVSPLPQPDKDLGHTNGKAPQISSPSFQQSINIHSLASPSRSSFEVDHQPTEKTPLNDFYQPLSPPPYSAAMRQRAKPPHSSSTNNNTRSTLACAMKKPHSSTTTTGFTLVTGTTTPHGRRSSSLHYNNRPLWNQTTSAPPLPSIESKKSHANESIEPHNKNVIPKTTTTPTKKAKSSSTGRRRHSYSSTTQEHQRNQRSRMLHEAKKTPLVATPTKTASPFHAVTPSCSVLFSKASPAANAVLAASTSPHKQQPSYRRQCPPPILSMEKSRSTPLRSLTKVKTYNVSPTTTTKPPSPPNMTPQRSTSSSLTSPPPQPNKRRFQRQPDGSMLRVEQESERIRRQQELEDLISGRRGSTLKLSLTPKNTLL